MNVGTILATSRPAAARPYGSWDCGRCGFEHVDTEPHESGLCVGCRTIDWEPKETRPKRFRTVSYRHLGLETPCRAWTRDFDDEDNPIHPDGTLVAPEARRCGHRDCVAPDHLIPLEVDHAA